MQKPTMKRLGLGFLQQMTALCIFVAVACLVFNAYVSVDSINGTQIYKVEPFQSERVFEESELFDNIFRTAVSDVTRLVVIKGLVETDGEFDGGKHIDVTEYAGRKGDGNDCPVTAVYELDELIKWGIYGVQYTTRTMSMSDFVHYFGEATMPWNFALDENGQLYFKGFYKSRYEEITEEEWELIDNTGLWDEWLTYSEEQLEDMVFSYIVAQVPENIHMSREEDGILNVYFDMVNFRYETVDNEKQLFEYADNWVDYMKLQNNLVATIESLADNYQQYQKCNSIYQEGNSNLKYLIRMRMEDGVLSTFTNVEDLKDKSENEITEEFLEYRKYFIYYPDSLEFTGTTGLTEQDMSEYLRQYDYAYPETTHIWIGVDTDYSVESDDFYIAHAVFRKIVPNANRLVIAIIVLGIIWLAFGVYLTINAGVAYDENGEKVTYLNPVDHIWLEAVVIFGLLLVYAGYLGFGKLLEVAEYVYISHAEILGFSLTRFYKYASFGIYGFLASMSACSIWYSLVRRVKAGSLWKDSFCNWVIRSIKKGVYFVVSHGNSAIYTLIPYNFFLLMNLISIVALYLLRNQMIVVLIIMIFIVIFDGLVGMSIFKNNAERRDIVEGIKRIRDGEVEYKLDVSALHGANKEMADAVNNIGEGIRKAVDTSMKDEQMKTDLITNVSHDIKTPLTSIINYVDLLKRLKIEEEPAKGYIDVLDSKSQRLKQLTDDLVEASKLSSGNIELNREQINLAELLNQTVGEFSERLEQKGLQLVFDGGDIPAYIYADSRRMWRVVENLFNNICKYALENTRVYLDLSVRRTESLSYIEMSLKNISERQMNIKSDDLTERFIRGDASRATEGSGLGLYIAKNLIEAQGGQFTIFLDGDLFKVVVMFPEMVVQKTEENPAGEKTEEQI